MGFSRWCEADDMVAKLHAANHSTRGRICMARGRTRGQWVPKKQPKKKAEPKVKPTTGAQLASNCGHSLSFISPTSGRRRCSWCGKEGFDEAA